MRFDRRAPGGGAELLCRLENRKALLEWTFHLEEESPSGEGAVLVRLEDSRGESVLESVQDLAEEEPLQAFLLQPRLWTGLGNPYLYHMEALLLDGDGVCRDRIAGPLPLRSISRAGNRGETGILLNGVSFGMRAVRYFLPRERSGAAWQCRVLEDFRLLGRLGANCLCLEKGDGAEGARGAFLQLCDRFGFLVCLGSLDSASDQFRGQGRGLEKVLVHGSSLETALPWGKIPCLRPKAGEAQEPALLLPSDSSPTGLYYRYMAAWSREPFVYIDPRSLKRLRAGTYEVAVYSSCSRVALYSDGLIHEFQRGEGKFVFRDFSARGPCIMLNAEGDGCSHSLAVHKSLGDGPGAYGMGIKN